MANAPDEVVEVCGTNTRCIFDATQTGNLAIGQETMQIDEDNTENQVIAGRCELTSIQTSLYTVEPNTLK